MGLTLHIIEHELRSFGAVTRGNQAKGSASFRDVRLGGAAAGADRAAGGSEAATLLYVLDGSAPAPLPPSAVAVLPPDAPAPDGALLSVATDASYLQVFAALQEAFFRYGIWEQALDASCLANEGVQALLDLSTPFTRNHLVVVDPALKLLAHSRDVPCDDPVTCELVEHGYHTEANIRAFKINKRFAPWSTEDGFIVNDSHLICRYVTVVHSFKAGDSFSLIVVMMCNVADPEPYLLDTLSVLIDRIGHYARRDYPADKPSGSAVHAFLRDALHRSVPDERELCDRSKLVGLPFEARFCLFCIPVRPEAVPTLRLLSDVARVVAPAKAVLIDNTVTVLCFNCHSEACSRHCMAGSCQLQRKAISARLNGLLAEHGLLCGRSTKFSTLAEAAVAYCQAREAAALGALARQAKGRLTLEVPRSWENIFPFDRCCVEFLVRCSLQGDLNLTRASYGCRVLDEIAAQDAEAGSDNYRFLYEYLRCERRSSVVAERLHMHRNNVKYRIDRIEHRFDLDTDDADLRFDLALAYRIREASLMQNAQDRTGNRLPSAP